MNLSKRNGTVAITDLHMKVSGLNMEIALDPEDIYIVSLFKDLDAVKQALERIRAYAPNTFAFNKSVDLLKIPYTYKIM